MLVHINLALHEINEAINDNQDLPAYQLGLLYNMKGSLQRLQERLEAIKDEKGEWLKAM